jgi:hypothetical protein
VSKEKKPDSADRAIRLSEATAILGFKDKEHVRARFCSLGGAREPDKLNVFQYNKQGGDYFVRESELQRFMDLKSRAK